MNRNKAFFHIAPPKGWLNDPNGLCQMNGKHHIFFQYSPDDPRGADKYWGHYETTDFINYVYTGIFLSPDTPWDKDGVYSGSAYVEDGEMYLYYTGNVKEDGDFDYVLEGRGANTVLVTSTDGIKAGPKELLLTNKDYTDRLSCHVRDPKIWKEAGMYHMVQGGRTKDDKGCILHFLSADKLTWSFDRYYETKEAFGYMWECPDLFWVGGHQVLSFSPQGVTKKAHKYQNRYQSGYFLDMNLDEDNFVEWDMGFDFYAPQTYEDETKRRILIGWMGVPDAVYDHDPSIEMGWQHMLTLPRQLSYDQETGRMKQWPVKEIEALRKEKIEITGAMEKMPDAYELVIEGIDQKKSEADEKSATTFKITFDDGLHLSYDKTSRVISLMFTKDGYGREERTLLLPEKESLQPVHAWVDSSCVELYINDGNYVFTTKYFTQSLGKRSIKLEGNYQRAYGYVLDGFSYQGL